MLCEKAFVTTLIMLDSQSVFDAQYVHIIWARVDMVGTNHNKVLTQ